MVGPRGYDVSVFNRVAATLNILEEHRGPERKILGTWLYWNTGAHVRAPLSTYGNMGPYGRSLHISCVDYMYFPMRM